MGWSGCDRQVPPIWNTIRPQDIFSSSRRSTMCAASKGVKTQPPLSDDFIMVEGDLGSSRGSQETAVFYFRGTGPPVRAQQTGGSIGI